VTKISLYIYGYLGMNQNVNSVLYPGNLSLNEPDLLPSIDIISEPCRISYEQFKKILNEINKIILSELRSDTLKENLLYVIKQGLDEVKAYEGLQQSSNEADLRSIFTIFNNGDHFWQKELMHANNCDEIGAQSLKRANESYREAFKRLNADKKNRCFMVFTKTQTNDDPLSHFNNNLNDLENGILFEREEEASAYLLEHTISGRPYLLEFKANINVVSDIIKNEDFYELARYIKVIHGTPVTFENNKFVEQTHELHQ
jgi:hypothetical protein